MTLTPEVLALIQDEQDSVNRVLSELETQRTLSGRRLRREESRAQELSSAMVRAKRDVDKQLLASDEAVAHGLRDLKQDEIESLEKLIERPYFARVVLDENMPNGAVKQIEFRLGIAGNSECRIVDWRKAPLARLYYEYKEGEEYFEEIQGRERSGRIRLRHKVEIEHGKLRSLTCKLGTFRQNTDGTWEEAALRKRSGGASTYAQLPDVLSIITPEQFQTITETATTAILIQGVAGSGKTTVALHRLAWLLHGENSDLRPEECAIILFSPSLQAYIRRSLESLGITDVAVLTYDQWAAETLRRVLPPELIANGAIKRDANPPPPGVRRVLRSMALLQALETVPAESGELNGASLQLELQKILERTQLILDQDETSLLDRDLIVQAAAFVGEQARRGTVDPAEDALLVRLYEKRAGHVFLRNGRPGRYRHLLVDEVQDFNPSELASIIGAVEHSHQLTLVGDTSQASRDRGAFPGWEKLRRFWSLGESLSQFVTLAVSHRSTAAIVRLAQYVQRSEQEMSGRPGKPPLWFKCRNEDQGVSEAIGWLTRVSEKYPGGLSVLICRDQKEAKYAASLLQPNFSGLVSLATDAGIDFDEGILVTTVDQVKGLEFQNVLIWNPTSASYPDKERARNLLYIAITRAEENLCIVTWGPPSPLLPPIHSKLVRGIERDLEEEEEEEPDDGMPRFSRGREERDESAE
ncbi:MAG: ATP-binding domain-containing protein [Bdellovibrionota bacterium]